MRQKHKSGWTSWITLALIFLFVVYPLSLGPCVLVCDLLVAHEWTTAERADVFAEILYAPFVWLDRNGPMPVQDAIDDYVSFWLNVAQAEFRNP
jgi:hypothetical protein